MRSLYDLISRLPNVVELNVRGCKHVNDAAVSALVERGYLKRVTALDLGFCVRVTDATAHCLATSHLRDTLRALDFSGTSLTPNG